MLLNVVRIIYMSTVLHVRLVVIVGFRISYQLLHKIYQIVENKILRNNLQARLLALSIMQTARVSSQRYSLGLRLTGQSLITTDGRQTFDSSQISCETGSLLFGYEATTMMNEFSWLQGQESYQKFLSFTWIFPSVIPGNTVLLLSRALLDVSRQLEQKNVFFVISVIVFNNMTYPIQHEKSLEFNLQRLLVHN